MGTVHPSSSCHAGLCQQGSLPSNRPPPSWERAAAVGSSPAAALTQPLFAWRRPTTPVNQPRSGFHELPPGNSDRLGIPEEVAGVAGAELQTADGGPVGGVWCAELKSAWRLF